ncbi:hypothetical protein BDW66DRAFT_41719 [Aspergillus desertorum]
MEDPYHVYHFGDQTGDFEVGLRRLLQADDHTLLSNFFQRSHHAVRLEISNLSPSEHSLFPRFTSIVDLLAKHCESPGNQPCNRECVDMHISIGMFHQLLW